MQKHILLAVFVSFSIFHPTWVTAQDMENKSLPSVWTLQQCIDFAKQNNIQVNTLRLAGKTSEQDLLLSKAAKNPNLSAGASQSFTNNKVENPVAGKLQDQVNLANNYSLNSFIVLYNGNYLNNDIKQKELSLQSADLDIQAAENDITIQVTGDYLNILLAKENITYLLDIVQTSNAQLAQAQLKFNAGSIAKKDLVQLEAQLASDKYSLVTAQNTEKENTLSLKQLLQLPSGFSLNITKPDTVIAVSPVTPLDQAQKAAMEQRPEIKSSRLFAEAGQLNLLKARAGYKPTISANGVLASALPNIQSGSYVSQLGNNFYQYLGLSLSVPIFNNRVVKTNVEKSKIAIEQANLDLTNTKTVLSQQVEQAYIRVLNAQSQYEAAVEQLNANNENYRIASEQLKLGAVSTVDYLLQKNLYVQALQAYIQAKYNAAITGKIYDFYKGDPVKL